eukprot:TRINITY_DN20945_c0_g1_i6.p1 TRINITY_DN20945_c0_g1~~TRINITY_DN20945_c0_g1_i6.p1  ORF type:complete len:397 (+),score=62.27 TRINITY_DN20945_c0_g1_i6:43-1233(+)
MAEPLNLDGFRGLVDDKLCTIEASCNTGFEFLVLEEVKEILGCEGRCHRGRVIFDINTEDVPKTLKLRTVNNLWVLVGHTGKFSYPAESEDQLISLADYAESLPWDKALQVWKDVMKFKGTVIKEDKDTKVDDVPSFRCSCYRTGSNHKFKSSEAQISVGGRIHDIFGWNVKMKDYDLEVVMNCDIDQVYVTIALTNKALFNRTLSHLGFLCLKPTVCACLVRFAKIEPGDVVLDPMCGGGSIPLEGSQMDTGGYFIGGEISPGGAERSRKNQTDISTLHGLSKVPLMDAMQWDALHPCLRDNSVDVIISDLPFGKRSGSKADNRVLYPRTMNAMARLVRPSTGRAVLLTQDKTSMFKTFGKIQKYWKLNRYFGINIGGLHGLIFLFNRTQQNFES